MRPALFFIAALLALPAWAQFSQACSSDGAPRPLSLIERFISADCDACWHQAQPPAPGPRDVTIDWVLPGGGGDAAPLAGVAHPDGLLRLRALGRTVPTQADSLRSRLVAAARTVRVAQGPALNDYVAVSIELSPPGDAPWTAWLLLLEHLPVGMHGTPVARNLVRGVLRADWNQARAPNAAEQRTLLESRSMRLPEGTQPERLHVVGWVEDARGRIRALAQTVCGLERGTL